MPPWEEKVTDKRKNSKSSIKKGITHSDKEALIDDGEGGLIHPAKVCAVLSRNEQLTPCGTGRLMRWKISQSWIKSLPKTDQTLDLFKPGCMFTVATENGLEFIKVLMCIKLTGSKFSRTDYLKHIEKNGFVVAKILLKDPDNRGIFHPSAVFDFRCLEQVLHFRQSQLLQHLQLLL